MSYGASRSALGLLVSGVLLAAPTAQAAPGEHRLVTGQVLVWPPQHLGHRLAVIAGNDGARYFVSFGPATPGPPGLENGDLITVVGRDGIAPNEQRGSIPGSGDNR